MRAMDQAELREDVLFEVLKVVVLKKMTSVPSVAEASSIPMGDAESAVEELAASGDVVSTAGHVMPTEEGEARVRAYADTRYATLREEPAVSRWVARFESLNRRFLETVSEWQTIAVGDSRVANDHSDPDYDARVISKLEALVTRMSKQLGELSDRVPRMARYRERLEAALERLDAGDERYVSDPHLDSIHTVWFEMHEAVLIVLGKEREDA